MSSPHPISFDVVPTLSILQAGWPDLKALFFDMDGTIFNTEVHHEKAFQRIGAEFHIRPPFSPEVVHGLLMGKADYLVYDIVKEWEGFPREWSVKDFVSAKNKYLLEILETVEPGSYFPTEIFKLFKEAKEAGLYLALVTSSEKVITKRLLQLAGISNIFDLELTRDDCPTHKPDPWPYNKALEISGFLPSEVIIFEDSHVGLAAASASGPHVIKVEWF